MSVIMDKPPTPVKLLTKKIKKLFLGEKMTMSDKICILLIILGVFGLSVLIADNNARLHEKIIQEQESHIEELERELSCYTSGLIVP